ncbi:Ig-like domain-containing protein [Motilibacter aurantiacus]|uniref:Ig-like domain-containing protein n=1 Tax=Motilibacter aurantiacus TaxID=2714955 RepID=UPI00140800F3|nr:Ig-like domain-containing protein [Motilibacter aurantiacus]NHC46003.1 Ig-like domain-containing protein [Motilibacter aurantiacus]
MSLTRRWRRAALPAVLAVPALLAGLVVAPVAPAGAATVAAPAGLAPDAGAVVSNAELTWAPVEGATGYEVQLSDSDGFDPNVLAATVPTPAWQLPPLVPSGDYVWRVRATTAAAAGEWSAPATLTRSWDAEPASPVTVSSVAVPVVSWQPVADASFYEVEFSADPFHDAWSYEGREDTRRFTCYTQHTYLAPYGTAAGKEALPGDETKCAFAFGEDPRVQWLEDEQKTCLDKTEPTARAVCLADAAERVAARNPMEGGKFFPGAWYWRVRGRDGTVSEAKTPFNDPALSCTGVWDGAGGTKSVSDGKITVPVPSAVPGYAPKPACSSWSDQGTFTFTSPAAVAEAVSAVPGGAAVTPVAGGVASATPVFSWQPVDGAIKYRLYVSRTKDLRDSDHVWETAATSLSPYGTLPDARSLYWGVQACGWRLCGPVSGPQRFGKLATSPVRAVSAVSAGPVVSASWTTQTAAVPAGARVAATDSEAKAYRVQVAVDGNFAQPVVDVTTDRVVRPGDPAGTSRVTLDASKLGNGTYTWRVRALDESGFAYPWSSGAPFRRDVDTPQASIGAADGMALTGAVPLAFSEPVTGVSGTTVGLVGEDGAKVRGVVTRQSGTAYTFTPSAPLVANTRYSAWVAPTVLDLSGKSAIAVGTTVRTTGVVDSASSALVRVRGGWRTVTASDAAGKSFVRATKGKAKPAVKAVLRGTSVTVHACRSVRSGIATVAVDGRRVATVDLYRGYSSCGRVATVKVPAGKHTVVVSATSKGNKRSRGTDLAVDAISGA